MQHQILAPTYPKVGQYTALAMDFMQHQILAPKMGQHKQHFKPYRYVDLRSRPAKNKGQAAQPVPTPLIRPPKPLNLICKPLLNLGAKMGSNCASCVPFFATPVVKYIHFELTWDPRIPWFSLDS